MRKAESSIQGIAWPHRYLLCQHEGNLVALLDRVDLAVDVCVCWVGVGVIESDATGGRQAEIINHDLHHTQPTQHPPPARPRTYLAANPSQRACSCPRGGPLSSWAGGVGGVGEHTHVSGMDGFWRLPPPLLLPSSRLHVPLAKRFLCGFRPVMTKLSSKRLWDMVLCRVGWVGWLVCGGGEEDTNRCVLSCSSRAFAGLCSAFLRLFAATQAHHKQNRRHSGGK